MSGSRSLRFCLIPYLGLDLEMRLMNMLNFLKKRFKMQHDRRIQKRDSEVGDQVIRVLVNYRFKFSAGKLVSK